VSITLPGDAPTAPHTDDAVPVLGTPEPATAVTGRARRTGDRVYALDVLRFCAAMAVLGFHLFFNDGGTWGTDTGRLFTYAVKNTFSYGWMGVEFFFVISGFVICMSSWGRSVGEFFISRVTRLMPAYVFAVLFTSAMLTLLPTSSGRPRPAHVLANATMLQGFLNVPDIDRVYWTLFVELRFYILFTIPVFLGVTYRRVVAFCVLWTVAALYAQMAGPRLLTEVVQPSFAPYFIAGIVLYLIHRFGPNLLLWSILGISMVLCTQSLWRQVLPFNRTGTVIHFEVALIVLFGFFLVMVAVALGWFAWLRWRGLVVVGALTYPVYLLHFSLSRVVLSHLHRQVPPVLLLVVFLAGVLSLAYLVHRLVERPVAPLLRQRLRASLAQIQAAEPVRRHRGSRRL
jgi:peptidoglycan/LPS O-acetylase OafA/YrhL